MNLFLIVKAKIWCSFIGVLKDTLVSNTDTKLEFFFAKIQQKICELFSAFYKTCFYSHLLITYLENKDFATYQDNFLCLKLIATFNLLFSSLCPWLFLHALIKEECSGRNTFSRFYLKGLITMAAIHRTGVKCVCSHGAKRDEYLAYFLPSTNWSGTSLKGDPSHSGQAFLSQLRLSKNTFTETCLDCLLREVKFGVAKSSFPPTVPQSLIK